MNGARLVQVRVWLGRLPRQLELNEKSLSPTGATGSRLTSETTYCNASAWWAQQDSNLRPADYESAALTN